MFIFKSLVALPLFKKSSDRSINGLFIHNHNRLDLLGIHFKCLSQTIHLQSKIYLMKYLTIIFFFSYIWFDLQHAPHKIYVWLVIYYANLAFMIAHFLHFVAFIVRNYDPSLYSLSTIESHRAEIVSRIQFVRITFNNKFRKYDFTSKSTHLN